LKAEIIGSRGHVTDLSEQWGALGHLTFSEVSPLLPQEIFEFELGMFRPTTGIFGEFWYKKTGMNTGSPLWYEFANQFMVLMTFEAQWFVTNMTVEDDLHPPDHPLEIRICTVNPDGTPDFSNVIAYRELTKDDIPDSEGGYDIYKTFEFTIKGKLYPDVQYILVATTLTIKVQNVVHGYWRYDEEPNYYPRGVSFQRRNGGAWGVDNSYLKRLGIWGENQWFNSADVISLSLCKDKEISVGGNIGGYELLGGGEYIRNIYNGATRSWIAWNSAWGQQITPTVNAQATRFKIPVYNRFGTKPPFVFIKIYETVGGIPTASPIFNQVFSSDVIPDVITNYGSWPLFNFLGPVLGAGQMYVIVLGTDDLVGQLGIMYTNPNSGYPDGQAIYYFNSVWFVRPYDIPFEVVNGVIVLLPYEREFILTVQRIFTFELEAVQDELYTLRR
jgi:hypothetical protein